LKSKVALKPKDSSIRSRHSSTNILQEDKRRLIRYDRKAESEFFVDNSALAGFAGERILYMSVRELIENSLDSCETNRILPSISVSLKLIDPINDMWCISCTDNGVGIPAEKVPAAVCSFLTSGKYVEKQQRGLFGVGLKMIAAFSSKDTDHPLRVWSKSPDDGTEYYFELRTDIGTNKPITLIKKALKETESSMRGECGFKIEAILRARLSPITKNKIYDYINQTSVVNPYSHLVFETDEGKVVFNRNTEILPKPAIEVLPHPADMDLKTLKKAIINFMNQKTTLQGVLCNRFQKLSNDKAREILGLAGIETKPADKYDEHELIRVVNICKQTKFQAPNTDHLSPIGEEILTAGMTSENVIVTRKDPNATEQSRAQLSLKALKPALTAYSSKSGIINNRPTIVECGIAYGGDINSFKLYRFANKIPLLYDEGSDVAREVMAEVEINKMGISKKEVKEQFSNQESKSDRAIELLPIHIFFHICSTKIPYKTAGKESIASEPELKKYMKSCLTDLYRKVSAQIRRELRVKEAENRLRLYNHYIPLIINAISGSIRINSKSLYDTFSKLAEKHINGEMSDNHAFKKIISTPNTTESKGLTMLEGERLERNLDFINKNIKGTKASSKNKVRYESNKRRSKKKLLTNDQITMDSFNKSKRKEK
jgi:DNA topoisomerase VI B subunit